MMKWIAFVTVKHYVTASGIKNTEQVDGRMDWSKSATFRKDMWSGDEIDFCHQLLYL